MTKDEMICVIADGQDIISFSRAVISGREALDLLPRAFCLRLWNLTEAEHLLLSRCRRVRVLSGVSVLAEGDAAGCFRRREKGDLVTEVLFSTGLALWEAQVSLSVEAGCAVSETVRQLLVASGTGISLLGFPGADPVRSRPQGFFGRAAECIHEALSAAGARGYLTGAGLAVVPREGLPVSGSLTDADLLEAPAFVGNGLWVLRTRPSGWTVGKKISVSWQGVTFSGLIAERQLELDTGAGIWKTELLLEVKNE